MTWDKANFPYSLEAAPLGQLDDPSDRMVREAVQLIRHRLEKAKKLIGKWPNVAIDLLEGIDPKYIACANGWWHVRQRWYGNLEEDHPHVRERDELLRQWKGNK